jgi:hypothetical protein
MKINERLRYKLGASPQLECWNAGILEKWVLVYRNVGLMVKFVLTKNYNGIASNKKPTIPLFHD